ncbi:MAG: hypothetical protein JNN27_17990 [Planctomycetes bacterium]|nr:hypothetical protein [Planctomycetota bacterium]
MSAPSPESQPRPSRFQRFGWPALIGGAAGFLAAFLLHWMWLLSASILNTPVSNAPVVVRPHQPIVVVSHHFEPDTDDKSFELVFNSDGPAMTIGASDKQGESFAVVHGERLTAQLSGNTLSIKRADGTAIVSLPTSQGSSGPKSVAHPVASVIGRDKKGDWRLTYVTIDMFGREAKLRLFDK